MVLVGASGDREGHGIIGVAVGDGQRDDGLDVLVDADGCVGGEHRVLVVDVLQVDGDRDGVVVGTSKAVADREDDLAGVVTPADVGLVVWRLLEGEDAAGCDGEEVAVGAPCDGVCQDCVAISIAGAVGPDGRLALVGGGGSCGAIGECWIRFVDVL